MSTTILLPLDGSALAERALPYATTLAHAADARLVLVRAALEHPLLGLHPDVARVAAMQEAERYLEEVARRLAAEGLTVDTAVPHGEAGEAIVDEAARRQARFIVMGTHGHSGLGRWLYGSVADDVLRHAEAPVLLVPATGEQAWPAGGPRTILVPLDGSALAEAALVPARELAGLLRAELTLLEVVPTPAVAYQPLGTGGISFPYDPEAELADARSLLEGVADRLRAAGTAATVQVEIGRPAPAIAAGARELGAGLIAMATHGRGGVARLVLGSVATGVVRHATVPVLLARPAALRETVEVAESAALA